MDIFIDSNHEFTKKSLTTGMVDMKRFVSNRDAPEKTYKVQGKTNFEGIGNRSDPWSYCPDRVRAGHNLLSTSVNNVGNVPFSKSLPRTNHNSIYGRSQLDAFDDTLMPTIGENQRKLIRNLGEKSVMSSKSYNSTTTSI